MLPSAYKHSARGRTTIQCHFRGRGFFRKSHVHANAANKIPKAAIADFSVSCSTYSFGTPTAGIRNIMAARMLTGQLDGGAEGVVEFTLRIIGRSQLGLLAALAGFVLPCGPVAAASMALQWPASPGVVDLLEIS